MRRKHRYFSPLLFLIVLISLIGYFYYFKGVRFFLVPSSSMKPTLKARDYIITVKIKENLPQRRDICVFRNPINPDKYYVKRVMGLPGDSIEIHTGVLFRNGEYVSEPYLPENMFETTFLETVTVPKGSVLVLGDNRNESTDSRDWGPVPGENLVGKVVFIYNPSRIGFVR